MSWQDTILTQYSASDRLLAIIDTFNQAISLDEFTDEFIKEVWTLTTCGTFGLDMWGAKVNVSRYIKADIDSNSFGFSESNSSGDYPSPFNGDPFYAGVQETETVRLSDDAYRTLIICKAFTNISIASIKEINRFLNILFKGRGVSFCVDYGDMRMGIVCEFGLANYEASILSSYDVLPIPSGVLVTMHQIVPPYFGFSDDAYPFNDGTFFRDI